MADLFAMLGKVKAKPGMYLGKPSVYDLFMFLSGYKAAKLEMGIRPTDEELEFYREFQPWLQDKFSISTSNSWAKIIQFYSKDEQEAFERFFTLLDEFSQVESDKPVLAAS